MSAFLAIYLAGSATAFGVYLVSPLFKEPREYSALVYWLMGIMCALLSWITVGMSLGSQEDPSTYEG